MVTQALFIYFLYVGGLASAEERAISLSPKTNL